jgi:hypothetical protein
MEEEEATMKLYIHSERDEFPVDWKEFLFVTQLADGLLLC